MVEMAQFYMQFCREESCGKCIPCRAGTVQLEMLLLELLNHRSSIAQLEQIKELAYMVKEMSLCGLGQAAPNPLLSTIKYFENEYLELLPKQGESI
jgi:bidirectional [NiFe] hydrogenase diaphorase subunit